MVKLERLPLHTKTFSRQLRRDMTDAEKHLWQRIRTQQLGVKFRRQHPLGGYILDFACVELKLALELDGGQHNELQTQDNVRTAWLESQGWKVLRFWNNEVLQNTDGVLESIYTALSKD
jgi:very-short-patch-repair endonuclease